MSFILDALKKSEFERQRQTEPGLMDARIAHRRRPLPVWAVLLGLLLGINIVVLLVLLMRSPNQRSTPADAAHGNPAAAGAATADMARPEGSSHFSPLDPAPVYAPEIPVADTAGASAGAAAPPSARASPPSVAPLRSPALRAGARDSHRPDPLLTEEDTGAAGADDGEVLPSISQISLTGAQALPELHLDVHVYATKSSDRFVYINMRKYHEGAVLQEGPTIERIRRDGVVLNFQGLRFLLPRQS